MPENRLKQPGGLAENASTDGTVAGARRVAAELDPVPARGAELVFLVTANALATLLRLVLFRGWVFRGSTRRVPRPSDEQVEQAA